MKKIFVPYRQNDHGSFDEEWPLHRFVSEWWYLTGYFTDPDEPSRLYSYQFTFIKPNFFTFSPYVLQLALTDVRDHRHIYHQFFSLLDSDIYVNTDVVNYKDIARLDRRHMEMLLSVNAEEFVLNFRLEKGKGAFWHGDDGVLVMGIPENKHQRTVYYSYPNMPTSGSVTLRNWQGVIRTMQIKGKSWFDRQWGPYAIANPRTHWEWFSLRFFDNEEVMLFAFPQDNYYDGTYINRLGERSFVRDYSYTPREMIEVSGMIFSKGWDLVLPGIKEEHYEIRPLSDGQLNLAYYELLAGIYNSQNEQVGMCVVELLPGARNLNKKIDIRNLFKKV